MFKRSLSLLLFLFFLLGGCYYQKQSSFKSIAIDKNPMQLEDSYIKDFGKIKEGEIAKHSFEIKNDSERVLNIQGVFSTCGCTFSEVKRKVLEPKESTWLDVKFNSKGYSGSVSQFVYVNTDSSELPVIKYTIKAEVVK
jgi:hypothetical protein